MAYFYQLRKYFHIVLFVWLKRRKSFWSCNNCRQTRFLLFHILILCFTVCSIGFFFHFKVSDWWEEYVYLRSRSPIMINSNFYAMVSNKLWDRYICRKDWFLWEWSPFVLGYSTLSWDKKSGSSRRQLGLFTSVVSKDASSARRDTCTQALYLTFDYFNNTCPNFVVVVDVGFTHTSRLMAVPENFWYNSSTWHRNRSSRFITLRLVT